MDDQTNFNPNFFNDQPTFQSAAGGIPVSSSNSMDRSWNRGYLALAEVTKVFPKRHTANIQVFHTEDKFESSDDLEGKNAAVIAENSAGFDSFFQVPYGEITPLYRGNVVLVGFLKNSSDKPIIIKVLHQTGESEGNTNFRNILPGSHDPESNTGDITDYLHVSPIQDFTKVDRFGNIEMASHTKSFLVGKNMLDDENFDFEDLTVKFPTNKTVINPLAHYGNEADDYDMSDVSLNPATIHVQENWSQPKKWMAVFRDKFQDSLTNWLRFIVDAGKTSLRILKQQRQTFSQGATLSELAKEGSVTSAEIDEIGSLKFRLQMDTRTLVDYSIPQTEDNPTQSPSKEFSDIQMLANGGILIQTVDKTTTIGESSDTLNQDGTSSDSDTTYPHTLVYIAPKGGGIFAETTANVNVYARTGISMTTDESIHMKAKKDIIMHAEHNITMLCQSNGDTLSSSVMNMTNEGSAVISAQSDGDNGNQSTMSLVGKEGNAAISTSTGGSGGTSASMSMTAEGTITQNTPGSTVTQDKGKYTNTSANIEHFGTQKSVGNARNYGNTQFIGSVKDNGRGLVLQGDRDSHGYRNWAIFASAIIQIAEAFVVNKAMEVLSSKLAGASAIAGVIKVAMNYYTDIQTISSLGWNGLAVTMKMQ